MKKFISILRRNWPAMKKFAKALMRLLPFLLSAAKKQEPLDEQEKKRIEDRERFLAELERDLNCEDYPGA